MDLTPQRMDGPGPDDDRLAEGLELWEELQAAGRDISAAELCRDCPELAAELQRRIDALKSLNWLDHQAQTLSSDKEAPEGANAANPRQPPALASGDCLGGFDILEHLGSGGMGEVYLARHRTMQRTVAIKIVRPSLARRLGAMDRFHREVGALASIDHQNVVRAYHADNAGETHFLVMEYVDGKNLAQLVQSRGPLPVAEAVGCILQAAAGLAHAHRQGVIHRDIKPSNLLRDRLGNVKVADLGLAQHHDAEPPGGQLTGTGAAGLGTLAFMSPEQARNSRQADCRSDVYSLGCTFFYLLTKKPPYVGETPIETFLAHRESPVPSLRGEDETISPRLDAIVSRMMAKSPDDRYQSMDEVIADLTRFLGDLDSPRRQSRRWQLAAAAVAAVACVGVAIGLRATAHRTAAPDRTPNGASSVAQTNSGDFVRLFNGRDLNGWTLVEPPAGTAAVDHGAIAVESSQGAVYLFTDRVDYADFHLRCEFLVGAGNESANLLLRADPTPMAWGGMRGYRVSIGRRPDASPGGAATATTLSLASCGRADHELDRVEHGPMARGGWHQLSVIVERERIQTLVDGELLFDHRDRGRAFRQGAVAVLCPEKSACRYRNIELREIAARGDAPASSDPRRRWVVRGLGNFWNDEWSVFQHVGGQRWIESTTEVPRFDRREFTEIARTDDYIDLERRQGSQKTVIRMRDDRGEIGPDTDSLRPWRLVAGWQDVAAAAPSDDKQPRQLLPLIRTARDAVRGKWQMIEGKLVGYPAPFAQLDVPGSLPEEYQLTALVQPMKHGDAFFLGLPVGDSQVLLTLNGDDGQTSGLALIDGRAVDDNATTRRLRLLHAWQANEVVCRVRKNRIEALCNGVLVADWERAGERLALPPPWKAATPPRLFVGGVNAWIQVAQLQIGPLKPEPPADGVAPANGPIDLLGRVELPRDALCGQWKSDSGALISTAALHNFVHIPVALPDEYRLTAVLSHEPGVQGPGTWIFLGLVVGKFQTMLAVDLKRSEPFAGLHRLDGKGAWENETYTLLPRLAPGAPCTLVCTVREGRVTVEVDGRPAFDWQGDPRRLSIEPLWPIADWRRLLVGADCAVRFSKLELSAVGPN